MSFNSNHTRRRYVAEPIANIEPLTEEDYVPEAATPLIDAAVKIIKATDEAVQKRGDDPNVVVVIQTDGQENVSVEYTTADLAALIKEKQEAGWQFLFLGAGLDAFDAARQAGINLDLSNVVSYRRRSSRAVFAATADNVMDYAESGDSMSLGYTPEQRAKVGDEWSGKYVDTHARSGPTASPKSGKKKRGRPSSTAEDYNL